MKKDRYVEAVKKVEELESDYADYIMENSKGDRYICNGDMLLEAMEDGYLADDFIKDYCNG